MIDKLYNLICFYSFFFAEIALELWNGKRLFWKIFVH
jgi:hypothetical protein